MFNNCLAIPLFEWLAVEWGRCYLLVMVYFALSYNWIVSVLH